MMAVPVIIVKLRQENNFVQPAIQEDSKDEYRPCIYKFIR